MKKNIKFRDRRYCETCGKRVGYWVKKGIWSKFIPLPAMHYPIDMSRNGYYCKNCSA